VKAQESGGCFQSSFTGVLADIIMKEGVVASVEGEGRILEKWWRAGCDTALMFTRDDMVEIHRNLFQSRKS
jgi:hypothetical protein